MRTPRPRDTASGRTAGASGVRELIRRFSRVRMLVAGDLIADEFIYGKIDRVSREAPVLILSYDSTEIVPGGAGNAANNAAALGAGVDLVGLVGRDDAGARLLAALPARVNTAGVARAARYSTPVKTRILAGGVHSAKQQVVRIDRAPAPVTGALGARVERALARAIARADVVVLSDYGSGLVTPQRWRRALAAARRPAPLVLVDSRYDLAGFHGMTACTPNEPEVEALLGTTLDDDRQALERAGRTLLDRLRCRAVLITRGSRGMALFEPGRPTDHIPIAGSDQVTDVTGAGDTVIVVFALSLAAGASFAEAARIANHAGGLVVMKRGTATVGAEELIAACEAGEPGAPAAR
ncbi:MAG: bifunctional hydroxymethylpyrimidine kinase/phosphomethylpyrimidine kinase [Acidobacteria bacterium]|nr:bifunctional hydroxymethylpyrimidine kinase/phosphomethylpyrimidine kinase [Acidobacteriota bacterium]